MTPTTAAQLIARSQSHTEIVHAEWSHGLQTDLLVACDDWTDDGDGGAEYWGEDEGGTWRVHLDAEAAATEEPSPSLSEAELLLARADYDVYR